MFEELLISGDQLPTENPKIFMSMESFPSLEIINPIIDSIKSAINKNQHNEIVKLLKENVEGYT